MKDKQASSTALLVAASLSYLSRIRQSPPLVPSEARVLGDWLLQHSSTLSRAALAVLDQPWFQALIRTLEGLTVPHIIEHYARRKKAIESLVREESHLHQLVVLGAGFDTLALRLATDFYDLKAFEVDHPATQAWKVKAVEACGLGLPQLSFLPCDFSLSWPKNSDLLGLRYRKDERAMWVAEGFFMYFSSQQVQEFFRLIRSSSPSGSRVAFTFMEPQRDGRVDFRHASRSVHIWLAQRREPLDWGIRQRDLPAFLSPLGFRLLDILPDVTREVTRLNVGEYLALAELC